MISFKKAALRMIHQIKYVPPAAKKGDNSSYNLFVGAHWSAQRKKLRKIVTPAYPSSLCQRLKHHILVKMELNIQIQAPDQQLLQ